MIASITFIIQSNNLKVEEATKISEGLREKLMKEVENLSYVGQK